MIWKCLYMLHCVAANTINVTICHVHLCSLHVANSKITTKKRTLRLGRSSHPIKFQIYFFCMPTMVMRWKSRFFFISKTQVTWKKQQLEEQFYTFYLSFFNVTRVLFVKKLFVFSQVIFFPQVAWKKQQVGSFICLMKFSLNVNSEQVSSSSIEFPIQNHQKIDFCELQFFPWTTSFCFNTIVSR